jgi:FAD/FMN-containing dehydrogenase
VWSSLAGLRKDNTGYDLKQLFVGSEGTLGIITAATLKLFPRPRSTETALVAISDVEAAIALLRHAENESGGLVSAFELIPRIGIEFVLRHLEGAREPLSKPYPWYALIEMASGGKGKRLAQVLEETLASSIESGLVKDAVVARSEQQRADFWALRENLSDVQRFEGGSIKHDISVPVSLLPQFISKATQRVEKEIPGVRVVAFGHIGDGNVHFNLSQPIGANRQEFLGKWTHMNEIVHGLVREFGGSISAEHGVGQLKRDEVARFKAPVEIALMRALKSTLDPFNLLNPGKLVQMTDK